MRSGDALVAAVRDARVSKRRALQHGDEGVAAPTYATHASRTAAGTLLRRRCFSVSLAA